MEFSEFSKSSFVLHFSELGLGSFLHMNYHSHAMHVTFNRQHAKKLTAHIFLSYLLVDSLLRCSSANSFTFNAYLLPKDMQHTLSSSVFQPVTV